MRVVHSTVGTLVHRHHYILIKGWSCAISSGVVYWLSGLCSVFQCYSYVTHYICTTHQLDCWLDYFHTLIWFVGSVDCYPHRY
jgi:hypothetical protein